MIFGQWVGKIDGDSNAEILLSVDKQLEDRRGSVSVAATDDTTLPMVCCIRFSEVSSEHIKADLDTFLGFTSEGIVGPQNNDKFQISNRGSVELTVANVNSTPQLSGIWKTDLGFTGNVTLRKVPPPRAGEIREVISWEKFKERISNSNQFRFGTFFRGQSDSSYPLHTCFHRNQCWDLLRYYTEVIPELFDYLGVLNNTRYPTVKGSDFGSPLLLAQHHGFPTPLLDWTLSPYVAAFFAFENIAVEKNPQSVRVFAFHEARWHLEQPQYTRGDIVSPTITVRPLHIPLAGNKRAVAQSARSIFSSVENIENVLTMALFPNVDGEVREMPEEYLDYFDISIGEKEKAMHDLQLMTINKISLFPELQTACEMLKTKYFAK